MKVKTHGILMSGEMIRAYKAGLKSQTRRTRGLDEVNEQPDAWEFLGIGKLDEGTLREGMFAMFRRKDTFEGRSIRLPYGPVGDTLWFKETHALICKDYPCDDCNGHIAPDDKGYNVLMYHDLEFRADTNSRCPGGWSYEDAKGNDEAPKWKPSIFMKHDYARFKDIPILNVRVERLKDITIDDAVAEGVTRNLRSRFGISAEVSEELFNLTQSRHTFCLLWDSINAKHGLGWDVNPWVFVYEFPAFAPPPTPPQSDKEQVRHLERGEVRS